MRFMIGDICRLWIHSCRSQGPAHHSARSGGRRWYRHDCLLLRFGECKWLPNAKLFVHYSERDSEQCPKLFSSFFRTTQQAALYSVRWYFNAEEFYRFVPKESPPARVFPIFGVIVDVSILLYICRFCCRKLLSQYTWATLLCCTTHCCALEKGLHVPTRWLWRTVINETRINIFQFVFLYYSRER